MRLLVVLLCVFLSQSFIAQETKNEKETSLKKSEVPISIQSYIDSLPTSSKVKWFKQTDGESETYEVKFKQQNSIYSLEFDQEGNLLDVEKVVRWNEIDSVHRVAITKVLEQEFDKHKLQKIQIQYIGTKESCAQVISNPENAGQLDLEIHYEIELKGNNQHFWGLYELLFSEDGKLELKRRIITRSTDNLNY